MACMRECMQCAHSVAAAYHLEKLKMILTDWVSGVHECVFCVVYSVSVENNRRWRLLCRPFKIKKEEKTKRTNGWRHGRQEREWQNSINACCRDAAFMQEESMCSALIHSHTQSHKTGLDTYAQRTPSMHTLHTHTHTHIPWSKNEKKIGNKKTESQIHRA